MSLKIGSAQLEDVQNNIPATLFALHSTMQKADEQIIDILCFPECFLQGYTLDINEAKQRALRLHSPKFNGVLDQLSDYRTTIILGMIEEDKGNYFNTAVVIRRGKLLGKYRKIHLFEKNFKTGKEYPIFYGNGYYLWY